MERETISRRLAQPVRVETPVCTVCGEPMHSGTTCGNVRYRYCQCRDEAGRRIGTKEIVKRRLP